MHADTRRFVSTLGLVFSPLFVLGRFGFAFTLEGAILIYIGLGMFVSGLLLRTPIWELLVFALGAVICATLSIITVMDYA